MKRALPFMTLGFVFLGACGLETPPAKLEFPGEEKHEAAAPAEEAPLDPALAAGKEIYDTNCSACHSSGVMGAPVPGNKDAWAPRIAQGMDVLVQKSIDGYQGPTGMSMPAKGGNPDLTDDQVKQAVEYMAGISK